MTQKSQTIEQLENSCHSFLQETSQSPKLLALMEN